MSASYLNLHSIAHVDGDVIAAVCCGGERRDGLRQSLDEAMRPAEVDMAGRCNDTETS